MKVDINDLTLGQIKELSLFNKSENKHPFEIGKAYFIRTVTMHVLGILKEVHNNELVLEECSWIADSGRFHDFLNGKCANEIEPFLDDVIVGRNAIIDATIWRNALPRSQK